jgi:hypothetical protein
MIPLDTLAKLVHASLFSGAAMPDGVQATAFKGGHLKAATFNGLTFVEQNPNTGSNYATMAKTGSKIMWVIRGGTYLGKVIDGQPDPGLGKINV